MNMRKTMRLALREYKSAVKTKGFIIGLIIAPVLMSGGAIAYFLLKDRVDISDKHIAVVDFSSSLAEALCVAAEVRNQDDIWDSESGKQIKPAYHIEVINTENVNLSLLRLQLSDRIRSEELHAFLEIGSDVIHPTEDLHSRRILYYAKNAAVDDVRRWFSWPINNQLRKIRLADAGIAESEVSDLFQWINVDGLGLVTVDEGSGEIKAAKEAHIAEAMIVPIALMMLLFLMIMMSVPGMLTSVMEEKTQRIAEVLLGSVKPFEFMSAKLLGGIAVSLTSSTVYLFAGIAAVYYMDVGEYVPLHVLPWFFIYMLLAIIMFGAISAALGSTCNEPKDAQSLTFPSLIPALIPMFVYMPVAKEPLSDFSTWISLVPLFTPTLMILRMATPEQIPAWQPYAGLFGVLISTVFFVWVAGRIFRVAILTQGTPPRLANMLKWAVRG
jgi:ABC-2 type transport system permease protein